MSIQYNIARFEPQLNCRSHANPDHVKCVVFGLSATNTETNTSAYIDKCFELDPCLTPDELNAQAETLMKTWADANDWYMQLQRQIYHRDLAPRPMPESYQSIDLSTITMGEDYADMRVNENNVNDQKIVEEVFGDALPATEPTEQPTEDPVVPAE